MNLINAIVNVQTEHYAGPVVVLYSHGDDTVTVLNEQTGHEFRVCKDALTVAPVTEQSVAWIAQQLLAAWQPFLTRLTRHLAEQLQSYATFGTAEEAEAHFQIYLEDPGKAFRALQQREV
jgi:hypothetical protein